MGVSIGDVYDFLLNLGAIGVLVWFLYFMSRTFDVSISRGWVAVLLGSVLVFVGLTWAVVEPKSKISKAKVVLYGTTAGLVIGVGVMTWFGWLPPIPMWG